MQSSSLKKRQRIPSTTSLITEKREDMNIYKQIFKLNPYIKSVDNLSPKEKFNQLKALLTVDHRLSPSDLKDLLLVHSLRQKDQIITDIKLLQSVRHKILLVKNNCGFIYLMNYRTQSTLLLNEIVLGKQARPENVSMFPMKEKHFVLIPEFSTREHFTAANLMEDSAGNISILLGTSHQGVCLVKYDEVTHTAHLISKTKSPHLKTIHRGPDQNTWVCTSTKGLVTVWTSIEGSGYIKCDHRMIKNVDMLTQVRCVGGEIYCWQHGSLYSVSCGVGTLVHRSDRLILDIFICQEALLIVGIDATVTVMRRQSEGMWAVKQTTKLALVSLQGAAVSLNGCTLIVLGQKTLFEEPSELSVYLLKDLCGSTSITGGTEGQDQYSDIFDLLSWALQAFINHKGEYTDILAVLFGLNKLEPIRSLMENALGKEDKAKHSAENVAGFMTEIQQRLRLDSQTDAKLVMNQFLLAISSSSDITGHIKSSIILSSLRSGKAEPTLLKSLKEGNFFECPLCKTKNLKVDIATMAGDCTSCKKKVALTAHQGNIQHIPDPQVVCPSCGIFHNNHTDRCVLCTQRVAFLSDLAAGY